MLPQIKKCRYIDETVKPFREGTVYRLFWHRWTAKGITLWWTLKMEEL